MAYGLRSVHPQKQQSDRGLSLSKSCRPIDAPQHHARAPWTAVATDRREGIGESMRSLFSALAVLLHSLFEPIEFSLSEAFHGTVDE
jgi:hypothetical protein